jgi:hypothetical protein
LNKARGLKLSAKLKNKQSILYDGEGHGDDGLPLQGHHGSILNKLKNKYPIV